MLSIVIRYRSNPFGTPTICSYNNTAFGRLAGLWPKVWKKDLQSNLAHAD